LDGIALDAFLMQLVEHWSIERDDAPHRVVFSRGAIG
jgi:hypothetical protein